MDLQDKEIFEERTITNRNKVMHIFDTIHESIFLVDPTYTIISANRAFSEEIGEKVKKIVGQKCYIIRHGVNAPCFEQGYECPVFRVFESGTPYSSTKVFEGKDNSNLGTLKSYVDNLSLLLQKYEELENEIFACLKGEKKISVQPCLRPLISVKR